MTWKLSNISITRVLNNSLKKHSYIIHTQVQKNNSKSIQIPLLRLNRLSSQPYDIPPFKNRSQNKFNVFFTQFQLSETLPTEKTRWLWTVTVSDLESTFAKILAALISIMLSWIGLPWIIMRSWIFVERSTVKKFRSDKLRERCKLKPLWCHLPLL